MSLTERTIAAAVSMSLAAVAPHSPRTPRFEWVVAQDAGAPDATASAGDAGTTPEDRAAQLDRALRAYEEALRRRLENSP